MKIDTLLPTDLAKLPGAARSIESAGFDGAMANETTRDPFVSAVLAAQVTNRLELLTGIAVAFARNPMSVAYTANDVHLVSGGRFILGLGSQVRAHIERRFSMPWSHPAARMREFIAALRAIWSAWNREEKLSFKGDFYQHTLMTPFFSPQPNEFGAPPVFLAAVGERMAEVAGEMADGLLVHPFCNERYLREKLLPAVHRGWQRAGRTGDGLKVAVTAFVICEDEQQAEKAAERTRAQIAFYGSTPAYRPVLEVHGWGSLHEELYRLSRLGRWNDMATLIDDSVLDAFAIRAPRREVASRLLARFGDIVDRLSFYAGFDADADTIKSLRGETVK